MKKGLADRLKEKQEALNVEYKALRAKELKEDTGTAVTLRQVVSTVAIIMFAVGVLGLLLINTC